VVRDGGHVPVSREPLGEGQVEPDPLALRQRLVGDVADERVTEPPGAGPLRVADEQLLVGEPPEDGLRCARHGAELGDGEGGAREDRRAAEQLPGLGVQVIDAGRDHRLHGGCEGDAVRRFGRGSSSLGAVQEHGGGLDDEEGVAATGLGHLPRPRLVERPGGAGELRALLGRQRREPDRERVARLAGPAGASLEHLVAGDHEHRERQAPGPGHQPLDELEELGRGRLHVLEDHHHRSAARRGTEEREQRVPRLGDAVGVGASAPGAPEHGVEVGRYLLRLLRRERRGDPPHGVPRLGVGGVGRHAGDGAGQLGDGGERRLLVQAPGPPAQHDHVVTEAGQRLLDQPGLADARLAEDRDEMGPAGLSSPGEELAEEHQLPSPPDQGDRASGRPDGEPEEGAGEDRLGEPAGLHRAAGPAADGQLGETPGEVAEEHLAGRGGLLEAGRQVHRRARDEELVRRSRARHDGPGLDPDPYLERHRQGEGGAQPARRVSHLERRPDGAERIVLVGVGQAEDGHHRVARELLHSPAKRDDAFRRLAVEGGLDPPEALRVEGSGELGRAHQVGEEDRDELPLLGDRLDGRDAAGGAGADARGKGGAAAGAGRCHGRA
jgi:hypothetical protein